MYQLAREVSSEIFIITKKFPAEEKYSLTDQIRRRFRSVGVQIAESWGKRRYENHFILKFTEADSEQYETQHWLETYYENGYIDKSVMENLTRKCESIGKMLNSMMEKAHLFCKM